MIVFWIENDVRRGRGGGRGVKIVIVFVFFPTVIIARGHYYLF
jgi:hypothetical protein